VDADDYVWAASFDRDSFIRFDPDTKTMLEYPLPGSGVIIRDIWADEQGRMWFAQNGLNKISSAEYVLKPAAR
jgi:streptogramin lyase